MSAGPLEEFLAIVRRDLAAEDARILEPGEQAPQNGTVAERALPGDHRLVVRFGEPPHDLDARLRRLDMLVDSFQTMLASELASEPVVRPSPARSLHEELAALATRAGAADALVIDARSPVVWGAAVEEGAEHAGSQADAGRAASPGERERERAGEAAGPPEPSPVTHLHAVAFKKAAKKLEAKPGPARVEPPAGAPPSVRVLRQYPRLVPDPEPLPSMRDPLSDRAIQAVRALPEMATLHKGGHVHASVSDASFGYVAQSFAGIYVLILVFREPFDELRAKRATVHALPIIERLVLALPPLDPAPMAGAMALRRGRRRR